MSDIKFGELLQQMRQKAGSLRRLAGAIEVTEKTVRVWLRVGVDLRLQGEQRDKVLRAAKQFGIEPEVHAGGVCLWDQRASYAANVTSPPPIPPVLPPDSAYEAKFLGAVLNSPFGASASVLTCTSGRVRFLAHTRNDLITYKTVRSREFRGHNTPNMFCVVPAMGALDPDRPVPTVTVVPPEECIDAHGYVNRYAIPCPPPERWQSDFALARGAMMPGQMLALSIVGTAEEDESEKALIDDFAHVAQMAVAAGADVIEINASCPNHIGIGGSLFHNLPALTRVCREVRQAVGTRKLILKIGFLKEREVSALVNGTLEFIDAYAAINTIPVDARRDAQVGQEPAFGQKTKAGLSGSPIRQFGLRCVSYLNNLRAREELDFGIVGIGGVTSPSDVLDYLHAGADVVQATSVFFKDAYFGIKVRRHLVAEAKGGARVSENEAWTAMANMYSAVRELQSEYPASKLMPVASATLLEWQANQYTLRTAGPRKSAPVPSIAEFKRLIKVKVDAR